MSLGLPKVDLHYEMINDSEGLIRVDPDKGIFKVNRKVFVSDEILAREREAVFHKCWLYLGHGSEVAAAGDFLTREVAAHPLIFNRGRDGQVQAFFNTCPHRGAEVCREASGNARSFTCFYHGWVFGADGNLLDQPGAENYAPGFNDNGQANLVAVPRLEHYRDLYFVNFDKDAMSLYDYLAGAKDYLDLILDQGEDGMEICPGAQSFCIDANWKLLCENSFDGYHFMPVHVTYAEYLINVNGDASGEINERHKTGNGYGRAIGNGHGVIGGGVSGWGRPIAKWIPEWGEDGKKDLEKVRERLVERFGEERANRIAFTGNNLVIFPNLVINDIGAVTIRTMFPRSPDYMEINAWCLAPKGESEIWRSRRYRNYVEFLGPGGFASPDDNEATESCQRGFRNIDLPNMGWADLSKGMLLPQTERPGNDETQLRNYWLKYNAMMTAE